MPGLLAGDGSPLIRGRWLVAAITSVCSAGFLLFGYDQGVMSGIVISDSWLDTMGSPDELTVGTITALYDIGAIIGAVLAAFTAEALGRKRSLLLGALLVLVGGGLMGAALSRAQFMAARVLVGVGIGYTTSATPVYQSEISSSEQRGWQVCCQLSTMLGGLLLAYWINYVFYFHPGSIQWRFPLAFQCVFALFILILTPFLPDTPRWLMRHQGTCERGLTVLARLRGLSEDEPCVQREKAEIMRAISLESREEGGWADLFRSSGVSADKRFYLAIGIQFMQQMTGINIISYFAPTLYKTTLGMNQEAALLLGCFTQLWYLAASFVTWFAIDRIGRRPLFISMALGMCLVLVGEAICTRIGTPPAAIAAVIFLFLFEACFTWGWMACVWIYPPEVLPLRIRAKGSALAAAADFFGNFIVVQVTPVGIAKIGWRFYLIWAAFNLVNAIVVYLVYPETGGLSLETIDDIFTSIDDDGSQRGTSPRRLQWSRVRIAADVVRGAKLATSATHSRRGSRRSLLDSDSSGYGTLP